jgi:zinc protease
MPRLFRFAPAARRGLSACLLAVPILAGLGAVGHVPAEARVFDPETFTLDNGLQVVVVTNRRAPIVTHMIWYKVGAADEAAGESGNAHFLEHLMFKGTDKLGPGEFSDIIALNGGRENAFTSYDYTGYYQTVARDRLEIVMEHEADRMTNLRLTDEVVLPEREVILEERRSRVDNNPGGKLREMMQATLFLNHPYRIPVIGWEHEIHQLSTETALAFYRRWYAPNNAVLVVGGDITAAELRPLAEKYYGAVPAHAVPERKRVAEPPQHAPRRLTLKSPQVSQPGISISYLAPSYNSAENEHPYALQILDQILGGGATSRLFRRLVVEQAIAASAGSGYGATAYDLGTFDLRASPRPGGDIAELEAALRAEIARLLDDGVTEAEVASAKRRLRAGAIFARDSLGTGPNIFGRMLATGGSVADVEAWPERIGAVTVEQVDDAAREVFQDNRSVTGLLLPAASE